jgi:hypothetical protein
MDIKSKLSEGLVIAVVPAIGYWFSYVYQLGYCRYFDIPTEFIEINIQNFFICIIGMISLLAVIIAIGNPLFSALRYLPEAIRKIVTNYGLAVFIMFSYSFAVQMPTKVFLTSLAIPLGLLVSDLIFPLFLHKDKSSYLEKLNAQRAIEMKTETMTDAIFKKIGANFSVLLFYASISSVFIIFAGAYEAKKTSVFMISNGGQKIVLKKYGDQFLVADFNKKEKTFVPRFAIEKIDNSLGVFSYEKVGPIIVGKIE